MARKAVSKMTVVEIDQEVESLEASLEVMRAEYKKLQDAMGVKFDRQKKLKEQKSLMLMEEAAARGEVPWAQLFEYEIGEPNYKLLNQAITTLCPGGFVAQSGYMPATMQYCIKVSLNERSRDKLDHVQQVLETLLPALRPNPETNEVFVDLMEPSLSEFGSYSLFIKQDGTWELRFQRYSRVEVIQAFKNTREMLEYVQAHMSFDYSRSSYDDDNDSQY